MDALVQIERLLEVIVRRRGKSGWDALREIRNAEKGRFGRSVKSQCGAWSNRRLRHADILDRTRGRMRSRRPVIPQAEPMFYFCSPWNYIIERRNGSEFRRSLARTGTTRPHTRQLRLDGQACAAWPLITQRPTGKSQNV